MATERQYHNLRSLEPHDLWEAKALPHELATWTDTDGAEHELKVWPEYAFAREQGRFAPDEEVRWLFRAAVGDKHLEADIRYRGLTRDVDDVARRLREHNQTLSLEATTLADHIRQVRERQYEKNVKALGQLIGEREFYLGYGGSPDHVTSGTFYLAKLEGVAAVRGTLGDRLAEVIISGRDNRKGRKPAALRTRHFLYEALQ